MRVPIKVSVELTLDNKNVKALLTGDADVDEPTVPTPPTPQPDSPDEEEEPTQPEEPTTPGKRRVNVRLHPSVEGKRIVSFGLPVPPGILASDNDLRVTAKGTEIPSYRKTLAKWVRVPNEQLLPGGLTPAFPGVRSVLVQFPFEFIDTKPVDVVVEIGTQGSKMDVSFPVKDSMQVVNDQRLYFGTEGATEPIVLASIDYRWLSLCGLHPLSGVANQSRMLADFDLAQKNFFGTMVKDYRTSWDAAPGSWKVPAGNDDVPLNAVEDGPWLYQRPGTFLALHARTGWLDPLREFYHAVTHYQSLLYTDADDPGNPWVRGFFKLKNPKLKAAYKDPKYSYAEDLFNYYLLTGDERTLPYFAWISAAQTLGIKNMGWTERFAAYGVQAHTVWYEASGDKTALEAAKKMVDDLVRRQETPNSEGKVAGCWTGNSEWVTKNATDPNKLNLSDGFSPWMSPLLMRSLVRYYGVSGDERVPPMLVKVGLCIVRRGMRWTDVFEDKNEKKLHLLVPFYGATTVGEPKELDGENPWAGIEHALNVAQGVAMAMLFAKEDADRQELQVTIAPLLESATWAINNWTRNTVGRPVYRCAPWRKYNWWFHNLGSLQWVLFGKPSIA